MYIMACDDAFLKDISVTKLNVIPNSFLTIVDLSIVCTTFSSFYNSSTLIYLLIVLSKILGKCLLSDSVKNDMSILNLLLIFKINQYNEDVQSSMCTIIVNCTHSHSQIFDNRKRL